MLEEKIDQLTKAVTELTARMTAKGSTAAAAPAAASAGAKRGPGRPPKSKHSAEDVKAALVNVKETVGTPQARAIITEAGAKDMADLLTKPETFDGVMEACEAALEPEEATGEDEGGDGL